MILTRYLSCVLYVVSIHAILLWNMEGIAIDRLVSDRGGEYSMYVVLLNCQTIDYHTVHSS